MTGSPWRTLGLVALVLVSVPLGYGTVFLLLFGLVFVTPVERLFRRHDQPVFREEWGTDATAMALSGIVPPLLTAVPAVIGYTVLTAAQVPAVVDFITGQPLWLRLVEAALLADFGVWLAHYLAHRHAFLWRFHSVHHSIRTLDWFAGGRFHPLDNFWMAALASIPLIWLGFPWEEVAVLVGIVHFGQSFHHMNVRWRMRWLSWLWITPEAHHWHHERSPEAWDKNFGAFLTWWDRLFGTYHNPADRQPQSYGISDPVPGDSYLDQLAYPFRSRTPSG